MEIQYYIRSYNMTDGRVASLYLTEPNLKCLIDAVNDPTMQLNNDKAKYIVQMIHKTTYHRQWFDSLAVLLSNLTEGKMKIGNKEWITDGMVALGGATVTVAKLPQNFPIKKR